MAACANAEGPTGSPGGRDGVALDYLTPRFQVVPAGAEQAVTLALRVSRAKGSGPSPITGARMEAVVEEGPGRLGSARVTANAQGAASFTVTMPAIGGKSRVVVRLESDPGSWLPFDVASVPVAPVELQPGAIVELDLPRDGVLLRFAGGAGREHFLIPHQTDLDRSGAAYRFLHRGLEPRLDRAGPGLRGPTVRASHPLMREEETSTAEPAIDHRLAAAASVPQQVSIQSCEIETKRAAPLRYLGRTIALYVDAPPDQEQARIDSIGRAWDEHIFPTNGRLFGRTTDMDGNERVLVVLTPELTSNLGIYCDTIRRFGVEIFYARWIPGDPLGRTLATLAHEHQHLINAGHHLRSRGAAGDARWLNEGLSFAAEALNGYWNGALIRMSEFLRGQNNGLSMMPLEYAPGFNDELMMFMLYLGDRFGDDVFENLGASGKSGVSNIEAVTGVPFEEILRDWFVAAAVSNLGLNEDPRFNYHSVDLHGMTAEIAACQCIAPGKLEGMHMEELMLGTPFDAWRTLGMADADYYRLSQSQTTAGAFTPAYDIYYDAYRMQTTRLTIVRSR